MAGDDRKQQQEKMAQFDEERGLADPPRPGESFEQFHARHIRAQTTAARDSAAYLSTIKLILQVFFWVAVVGFVLLVIQIGQASSRY